MARDETLTLLIKQARACWDELMRLQRRKDAVITEASRLGSRLTDATWAPYETRLDALDERIESVSRDLDRLEPEIRVRTAVERRNTR